MNRGFCRSGMAYDVADGFVGNLTNGFDDRRLAIWAIHLYIKRITDMQLVVRRHSQRSIARMNQLLRIYVIC